jgi:isopenicillin-N epimerase
MAEALRRDFLLDPEIVHLNHGSFGATPLPVLAYQQELRAAFERDPVELLGRRLPELLAGERGRLATYLDVADPNRLVLVANATTALNAVATSLPLAPGDEVVITDREYGAMELLWNEVARRAGARLVTASVGLPASDEAELVDAMWSAVTPRTRVLFFSHITSETALVLPATDLCRRAHEAGIISVVDGAHGPGHLPLALDEIGADCYAGNGHKWLCAPKGSGFLYVRDELQSRLRPPVVTWARNDGYVDRFAWSGTDDPTAMLSLGAAIEYQRQNDWPAVQQRCRELARRTQTSIVDGLGGDRIAAEELQAPQMVAFSIEHDDAPALQRELRNRHRIEIPVHAVDGRTLVRLSVAGYTSEEDCRRLVEGLSACTRGS